MTKHKRLILVVDDDAITAELLCALLERDAFEVDVETDGIHVVEPKRPYDVILLDLKMPILDGERLTEYWGLTQPDLLRRVIFLSGYPHLSRRRDLPRTFAVIDKPFDHELLLALVDRCAAQADADVLSGCFLNAV